MKSMLLMPLVRMTPPFWMPGSPPSSLPNELPIRTIAILQLTPQDDNWSKRRVRLFVVAL